MADSDESRYIEIWYESYEYKKCSMEQIQNMVHQLKKIEFNKRSFYGDGNGNCTGNYLSPFTQTRIYDTLSYISYMTKHYDYYPSNQC